MTILLDPSRHGCHIWFLERKTVKYISDTYEEIANRIYKFCTFEYLDETNKLITEQAVNILIDANGFGVALKDCLEGKGLKLQFIKSERDLSV